MPQSHRSEKAAGRTLFSFAGKSAAVRRNSKGEGAVTALDPARHDRAARDFLLALPTALVALLAAGLAWREYGSILAEDWLVYAVLAVLVLATVLAAGVASAPPRYAIVSLGALAGLAVWDAASAAWAPSPALARDEALLVALYLVAVAVPLVTLPSERARTVAVAGVVAVSAALALATALALAFGADPEERYYFGRLASPIGYVNGQAAAFLFAFWPAVALAARRSIPAGGRALATAAATMLLAGGLLTQSKGGAVATAAAAIAVLAVSSERLRLAVPTIVALALVALSYDALTEPFRARTDTEAVANAAREAGDRVLLLALVALVIGAVYAFLDARIELRLSTRRALGLAAAAAAAVGLLGLAVLAVARVDHPVAWVGDRWEDFKTAPEEERGSSHLVNLGSNRYDFWRVALDEFRDHPIAGIGARGWEVAYLQHGRSEETPARAHSVELDHASETGIVGLVLLAGGLLPLLAAAVGRARQNIVVAGTLGAAVYWLVHASGDWIWTLPAVGVPLFLLLGTGAASVQWRPLHRALALPAAGLAAAVAVLVFAPPWISARITMHELEQPGDDPAGDLRWARRLDPLSVEPLIAEASLVSTPDGAIPPLRRALRKEPRSAVVHYLLGRALLRAGEPREAVGELERARRLAPRDAAVAEELRRARRQAARVRSRP